MGNNDSDNTLNSQQSSAAIRVIGDRSAGKTTYMASLARWPNASPDSPVERVLPIGEDSEKLVESAQNILEQGLELEPTPLYTEVTKVKDYTLSITLKNKFKLGRLRFGRGLKPMTLNINCKDYSGEFFSDLLQQSMNPQLQAYLEDCLEASGILFLVDGMGNGKDREYARGLEKFLIKLDQVSMELSQRRVAFAVTKCEQSELWVNHEKPTFVASKRFPQTYKTLEAWQKDGSGAFDCFATSAFGMVGTKYPKPNAKRLSRERGGVTSIIEDPKRWRPFGLVAPIYWLSTGKRHPELDKV